MAKHTTYASLAAGISFAAGLSAAPLEALVSSSGKITLRSSQGEVGTIQPGLFEDGWRGGSAGPASGEPDGDALRGIVRGPSGTTVDTTCRIEERADSVHVRYSLVPRADITVNSYHINLGLPAVQLAGRSYVADGETGDIPEARGETHIRHAPTRALTLATAAGGEITLKFPEPTPVLLQDDRQWGPSFSVRIGEQYGPAKTLPAGGETVIEFTLSCSQGVTVEIDRPVTITAGEDWVPLDYDVEIEPGSVLDFSTMGLLDAPAGKHGRLIARPDAKFAFEDTPETSRRFYGVNFCFSAHYLDKEEADRLAARIVRMGYNTIRIHHYESMLVRAGGDSGTSIADIPLKKKPTVTETIDRMQVGERGDHYGQRLRGFLHPPGSGDYVFRVASDDNSEVWLGAGNERRCVASVSGWTGSDEFDKYPSQQSEPIRLEAGKVYAIEVLHKEGSGGDHVAVVWEGPGGASGIIPGEFLSTPDGTRGGVLREIWEERPVEQAKDSTRPIPERLDQLDYFIAAFKKRGVYITTDLFVSRPVYASEIYDGAQGDLGMSEFKMAVPVNEHAFENWKAFSRNLLTHRNPYTGLTYAEDPALAWLSMINEGNVGNMLGSIKGQLRDEWQREWNRWLADRYRTREALQAAWDADPKGDPAAGTVPLATSVYDGSPTGRDLAVFCASVEERMFSRMKTFLRDELGCKALLTNMNGWTNRVATHVARTEYDYVDDHFYVDHPHFLVNSWQLPSSCPNTSPIRGGATGGRGNCFVRLLDKPFTISEYNYSGPGRFRGVGGILTGCLGALQGWDVIWRFAYSHSRGNLFQPATAGYFDIVTDPLNQVADRAAVCLYLRGDLREAPHSVAIAVSARDLREGKTANRSPVPGWSEMAWVTKVGAVLTEESADVRGDIVLTEGQGAAVAAAGRAMQTSAYDDKVGEKVIAAMEEKGWLPDGAAKTWRKVLRSETGEITIDSTRDVLVLDTSRTAGGYAPEGESVETKAVTISVDETDATVWVSSMDGQPIADSRRMILCHLTDLQNTGARFGEKARKTLHAWGSLPHLVRDGSATVRIRTNAARDAKVYALSTSGARLHTVEADAETDGLIIRPAVRGPDGKARLVYEIVVE